MASPFPPTSQVPLHRNPPLAPSQELAYRKKCIDLRRRLREIQSHNETVQARIYRERAFHDKMRLNRAILMQHLQDVVDGGQLSADQIEALRATRTGGSLAEGMGYDSTMTGIDHHAQSQYLDDETELSGEEELPEPQERPLRSKRAQNYTRDQSASHNQAASGSMNGTPYTSQPQPATLPPLAPSPAPLHPADSTAYAPQSTTRTPPAAYKLPPPQPSAAYSPSLAHPHPPHPYYGHAPPPNATQQYQQPPQSPYGPHSPTTQTAPPIRPPAPFDSFINEKISSYTSKGIPEPDAVREISQEWYALSPGSQRPWIQAYENEMQRYERQKDEWKRQNKLNSSAAGTNQGGFRAVNQ